VRRGKLVVLEGPEGVGKTTQAALLSQYLASIEVPHAVFREPGGSAVGERVRGIVLDASLDVHPRAETLLFLAARAQLMHVVRSRLALGEVVLLDRFFLSTYAYQVAGRGLPERAVREANAFATDGLVPDLTLLLAYPVGAGLERVDQRGARDRMERAGIDFHERVAAAFSRFLDDEWQREHPETGHIETIDARGAVWEVSERIISFLGECWPETFRPGPWSE
jgi:dTMP kinase